MQQTFVEKTAQKFAAGLETGQSVRSGDIIMIQPAYVMTHDNTGAVIPKFRETGAVSFNNPRQVVTTLDHNIQDKTEKNLEKYQKIENFARSLGAWFYPAGRGIGHQIMCEEGFIMPGTMVVASDSHSNMYGGLGALGTPVVRTDAASVWATGKTWWKVPPVSKVILEGEMRPGVTGKDVIIALCGILNKDDVLNHAIEFHGAGIKNLTVEQRLAIANMTTEWGALAGVFIPDDILFNWLEGRIDYYEKNNDEFNGKLWREGIFSRESVRKIREEIKGMMPDKDAFYVKEITVDLSTIPPYISGPDTVKKAEPASSLKEKKVKIDKAYLVSCVNSRFEDIREAASVLKGKKAAEGVKFYVSAASGQVQLEAENSGDWQILLDAGAITLPPGCGPCIGLGVGLLEPGETGISSTNRNYKGRMGSPEAHTYLASPAVVAQSVISGYIDFESTFHADPVITVKENKKEVKAAPVKILPGFPEKLSGNIIFCNKDNINTDGIYPGKYTYRDDFTPEEQASVVMENYDENFRSIISKGDIVVGGFNFGTGSSREQAATALKYAGIPLVIAGSFSETYKRNAINNGLLITESPSLVNYLRSLNTSEELTVKAGGVAEVDFINSKISFNGMEFSFDPIGAAAQEVIMAGRLEEWIKSKLESEKGV